MFQTFISRHNSNFFSDKLVLTSVTPASSAPVLQTPKATSSTLYFDSLTVNAGNGGFLHCIQMDTSVNAANQVVSDRKSGSAGMPRPTSYAVFCLKKKTVSAAHLPSAATRRATGSRAVPPLFFLMGRRPRSTTLFPYTTLFRSQTPKATSSTLYFDSLTVNAGNGGFLHCIQMDTSVNAANQVVSVGADIAFDADPKFFACLV